MKRALTTLVALMAGVVYAAQPLAIEVSANQISDVVLLEVKTLKAEGVELREIKLIGQPGDKVIMHAVDRNWVGSLQDVGLSFCSRADGVFLVTDLDSLDTGIRLHMSLDVVDLLEVWVRAIWPDGTEGEKLLGRHQMKGRTARFVLPEGKAKFSASR